MQRQPLLPLVAEDAILTTRKKRETIDPATFFSLPPLPTKCLFSLTRIGNMGSKGDQIPPEFCSTPKPARRINQTG
jgi:hypothetical protein